MRVGSGIESFLAVPYRPPNPEAERFVSLLRREMHETEPRSEQLTEPGFCVLMLGFDCDEGIVTNGTPVMLSYRQSLARFGGERRFFYMPIFEGLPGGLSTTDTNYYSLTFQAVGCSLLVTNGAQTAVIENGCSATFAPQIHQPFRATAKAVPNQQGGANGMQPFSSSANRTSASGGSP